MPKDKVNNCNLGIEFLENISDVCNWICIIIMFNDTSSYSCSCSANRTRFFTR